MSQIAITEVETRILRACKTIRALPDRERRFFQVESGWPDYVRDPQEAYGYNDATLPRFRPTPADVDDCLPALAWARILDKKDFRIVWMRSFELSFGTIGRAIYKSDETARRYYRDLIVQLWAEANKKNLGQLQKNVVARVAIMAM